MLRNCCRRGAGDLAGMVAGTLPELLPVGWPPPRPTVTPPPCAGEGTCGEVGGTEWERGRCRNLAGILPESCRNLAGSAMSGNIGVLYQPNGIAAVAGDLAGDLAGAFAVGGLVAAIAVIAAVSICDGLIAMEMATGAWFGRA